MKVYASILTTIAVGAILFALACINDAHAQTILLEQPNFSTESGSIALQFSDSMLCVNVSDIGTDTIVGFDYYLNFTTTGTFNGRIDEFDGSCASLGSFISSTQLDGTVISATGPQLVEARFAAPHTFDPTTNAVLFSRANSTGNVCGAGNCTAYGTTGSLLPWYNQRSTPSGIDMFYFVLFGEGITDTTTRIVEQIGPQNATTTPSTSVDFEFQYYWNETTHPNLTTAGVFITNTITGETIIITEDIVEGLNTFSETTTLITGNQYSWRPFLLSDINGQIVSEGEAFPRWAFWVETNTGLDLTELTPEQQTAPSGWAGFYNGLISQIRNNPPFKVIFDIVGLYDTITATTATATINFPTAIQDDFINPLKTAQGWLLWILFMGYSTRRLLTFNW